MKHLIFILLCICTGIGMTAQNKNIAYKDDNVRFTVITDGTVRMEWSATGSFVDDASQVAVKREYPKTEYNVRQNRSKVEITTPRLTLVYKKGKERLSADNLSVSFGKKTWRPGMQQQHNLKGTFRTLDGLDGDVQTQDWCADMKKGETRHFEPGLLARDGWTLIDDSDSYLFDGDKEWDWVKPRPDGEHQDWYFMAYGNNYKQALKDFTVFAGNVPLPPRYAFGYWWSRYWTYSDRELRELTDRMKVYGFPLDVLVVDMDWHYTDPGRGGWTGWTWNKSLFPQPSEFMKTMRERGIKTTLNLHPADGIEHYEEVYPRLAAALDADTAGHKKIEWTGSDKRFMQAAFDNIFHPMQKQGVAFWWLDWQQHIYDSRLTRLNNTWWINYCFFSDMQRNGNTRPLLFHRWGGLGNHRYQVGFSGDAIISWKSLDFQPYFTSTASNVLYGYWSHDLGGHIDIDGKGVDPEMYTRWMQFGALSPVMRTHSSKNSSLNKEPWVFPAEHTEVLRRTVRMRYALVPYIYTMARRCHDDGVSLCRPLYYDSPDADEAYTFRNEYMFGDDMLIAPVTSPATDGYTRMQVWLPKGMWYEWHTGTMLEGGRTHTRSFALHEYGIYIKAGAVLPTYGDNVEHLERNDEPLTVNVFPGAEGEFTLYEDGGDSKDYETQYATTRITSTVADNRQTVTIAPRRGSYDGMPATRHMTVRMVGRTMPGSVRVNGQETGCRYIGDELSFDIALPETPGDEDTTVEITWHEGDTQITDGTLGRVRRMGRMLTQFNYRVGQTPTDGLAEAGSLLQSATYTPSELPALMKRFNDTFRRLPELLEKQKLSDADRLWVLKSIDYEGQDIK